MEFDKRTYFLGQLCSKGHKFGEANQSLRYVSTGRCVRCELLRARQTYDDQMILMKRDPEMYDEYRRRKNENSRRHYEARKNDPKFHVGTLSQKNQRRRSAQKGNHHYKPSPTELEERWKAFGHACAYCGADSHLTIDHVNPVVKAGPHVLGNIVPSCKACNSSKQHRSVWDWYREQSFFDKRRWKRIKRLCSIQGNELLIC